MQSKARPDVHGFECGPQPEPEDGVSGFVCAVYAGEHPQDYYHQIFDQVMIQLGSKYVTSTGTWEGKTSKKRGYQPGGEEVTTCDKYTGQATVCVEVAWYESRPGAPPTSV